MNIWRSVFGGRLPNSGKDALWIISHRSREWKYTKCLNKNCLINSHSQVKDVHIWRTFHCFGFTTCINERRFRRINDQKRRNMDRLRHVVSGLWQASYCKPVVLHPLIEVSSSMPFCAIVCLGKAPGPAFCFDAILDWPNIHIQIE